jgi:dsDNA-binding SOS-regulon protein
MKWIKSRRKFILDEAKIKDVILPKQKAKLVDRWGEKWLDLEQIDASDKIVQGKWKLTEEEKRKALGIFLTANIDNVYRIFENLPDKFIEAVNESIDLDLLKSDDKWDKILNNFNFKQPSINQISVMTDPIFRKISVGETQASEVILRDETGRPIMGETGRPQKVAKDPGKIVYSKNLVNINSFVDDFNRCFPENSVDASVFQSGDISRLVSKSREDFSGERYIVEVDIYNRDLFLSIQHNAKDILNMSISRFYSSCQNLYTGGYSRQVLANVFDPNSCPAFLIFDTPIYNSNNELISEQLPLTRMMVRNIENLRGDESKIFFDRAYPDRMYDYMSELVKKYTNMEPEEDPGRYLFTPDIPMDWEIQDTPYMDRLGLDRGKYIGINARTIILTGNFDWSKSKLSPKAKIEEIVIETTNLPGNFFDIPLTPEWVKIRYIKINSLQNFSKIETKSLAFDKCKLSGKTLVEYKKSCPAFEKLQIISCLVSDLKLSELGEMEEIHLVYSIDPSELVETLQGVNCKKLVLSGDLLSEKENKEFINSLKKQGVKVEITGLVI